MPANISRASQSPAIFTEHAGEAGEASDEEDQGSLTSVGAVLGVQWHVITISYLRVVCDRVSLVCPGLASNSLSGPNQTSVPTASTSGVSVGFIVNPMYGVPGVEPRALSMLSKHSTT